jgi:hypothetical protein
MRVRWFALCCDLRGTSERLRMRNLVSTILFSSVRDLITSLGTPSKTSDLGNPTVHEDFASGDEATVVEARKLTTFATSKGTPRC